MDIDMAMGARVRVRAGVGVVAAAGAGAAVGWTLEQRRHKSWAVCVADVSGRGHGEGAGWSRCSERGSRQHDTAHVRAT
jgi:hypothetical protein